MQDLLERFAGVYQQQRAAIAALETHLRAYGYSAECPCHAPADPLAALQSAQQSPVSSGDKAGSAGSPAGGAGDAAAALGRSSDSSHAAAAIAEDKASAAGWADAAHRMACTATPADDSAALAPKGAGTSEAAAGMTASTQSTLLLLKRPKCTRDCCTSLQLSQCKVRQATGLCPAFRVVADLAHARRAAGDGDEPAACVSCAARSQASRIAICSLDLLGHSFLRQPLPQVSASPDAVLCTSLRICVGGSLPKARHMMPHDCACMPALRVLKRKVGHPGLPISSACILHRLAQLQLSFCVGSCSRSTLPAPRPPTARQRTCCRCRPGCSPARQRQPTLQCCNTSSSHPVASGGGSPGSRQRRWPRKQPCWRSVPQAFQWRASRSSGRGRRCASPACAASAAAPPTSRSTLQRNSTRYCIYGADRLSSAAGLLVSCVSCVLPYI